MVNKLKQNLNKEYYERITVISEINETHQTSTKCNLPSVTRILNATMSEQSKAALEKWKNSMIEKLGEDGFNQYTRGTSIIQYCIND